MTNLNIEDQKHLHVLTSIKKKINIVKIRTSLTSSLTKKSVEQFLKHHKMKEFVISVALNRLKMKITYIIY